MKKIIIALCVALVVFAVGYNAYQSEKSAKTGLKKVYAVMPLTGSLATLGQEGKKVMDFMMKNGDYPFKVVYIDSEGNPMKALTALQAATVSEKEPIVFSFILSSVNSALAPYIAKKNGFLFGVSTSMVNADCNNWQLLTLTIADVSSPLVDYVLSHHRSLDIVYIEDEYGVMEAKYVADALNKKGLTDIRKWAVPLNITDVRNEVVKILSKKPEAILIVGVPNLAYVNLFRNLKQQGFKGTILADNSLASPWVQDNVGKDANGIISVAEKIETEADLSASAKTFKEQMTALGLKVNQSHLQAADTLNLIKYTIDKNLPFERATYENLQGWDSASGDHVVFKDGQSSYPTILVIYKDGKYYPYAEEK